MFVTGFEITANHHHRGKVLQICFSKVKVGWNFSEKSLRHTNEWQLFWSLHDFSVKIRFSRFYGNIQLELCEQCILQIRTWYEGTKPKGDLNYLQVSEIYCSHILGGYSSNWIFKQMKYTNGKKWETCSYHWWFLKKWEKCSYHWL